MDGGAWGATVRGVEKSRTRLSDFTHSLTHSELYSVCGVIEARPWGDRSTAWKRKAGKSSWGR